MHKTVILWFCLILILLAQHMAFAQSRIVDVRETTLTDKPRSFIAPYVFYNEQFDLGLGGAYGVSGYPQPQASTVVSLIGSTNTSWAFFLIGRDYQLPVVQRLFLDPWISAFGVKDLRAYRNGNPNFPNEQAGSNSSDEDNFIEDDGNDVFAKFTFKYLLPLGHGKSTIINTYEVDKGLLVRGATGGGWWNPLKRGRTYLEVEPFYRRQKVDSDDVEEDTQKTNGMTFALVHDNTDFFPNPSRGNYQRFAIGRDWGLFDSTTDWTVVEGEYSHYVSLGSTARLRQQVLAFNFWTAETLTWEEKTTADGRTVLDRPPTFAGATLGGLFRMRGFDRARFSDRTAIYYALEYRFIPEWNPFAGKTLLKQIRIDWLQGVLFAEVGRVADKWSLSKLHENMKGDVGVGVRAYINRIVVRIDIAGSEEGAAVQMIVAQAF